MAPGFCWFYKLLLKRMAVLFGLIEIYHFEGVTTSRCTAQFDEIATSLAHANDVGESVFLLFELYESISLAEKEVVWEKL